MTTLTFRARDEALLEELLKAFSDAKSSDVAFDTDGVEPELGVAESWFIVDGSLTYAAGVSTGIVANFVTIAIQTTIQRWQTTGRSDPAIEVSIDGRVITEDDLVRLTQALQDALKRSSEE